MSRGSLADKALWNSVAWLSTVLSGVVTAALIYRRAGDAEFGVWATVLAFRAILVMLDGGLALGVSRDTALLGSDAPDAWGRIRGAWRVYAGLAALALVLGVAAAGLPGHVLGATGEVADVAAAVTMVTAAEAAVALATAPLAGMLRGRQRFGALAIGSGCQAVLGIALVSVLLPAHGLVGAAWALLAARIAAQAGTFWWMRTRGLLDRPAAAEDATPQMRAVAAFALPLWITALGAFCAHVVDVPLVGALFGEVAAGHCALGDRLAGACAGLLFAVLGAAFPRFVTARPGNRQEHGAAVLFLGCTLAAAGFGLLISCGPALLRLWVGDAPVLAVEVLAIYALVWTVNTPAHVLSSMAIAAGRHRVLNYVVLGTVPLNVGLSVLLALRGMANGPALASLVSIVVGNWIVCPLLLLPRIGMTFREWLRPTLCGYGAGAAVALVTAGVVLLVPSDPLAVVATGVGATLLLAASVLDLNVRNRSSLRRAWRRTVRSGWPVLWRQAQQCRRVRQSLGRDADDGLWNPAAPPLVTVRIATYNRGRLVAERALASAERRPRL